MVTLDENNKTQFYETLVSYIKLNRIESFREHFFELHYYDQAEFFLQLDLELQNKVFLFLSPKEMADIFQILPASDQKEIFDILDKNYAATMLSEMYVDDAADFLGVLEDDNQNKYLKLLDVEEAIELKNLLKYPEDTAGGIMTTEYISIIANHTVERVIQQLKKEAPEAETVYYLYVVEDNNRLVGVCSLRDLIIADSSAFIKDIMSEHIVSVNVFLDQEKVADIVQKYNFLALPVIDDEERLVGIVTVDDIMDVIEEEAIEDISKLSAIHGVDFLEYNSLQSAKSRLPWLIMLLFIGMGTASIIGYFEGTLKQAAILASFIPLIGGMGGNAGTQALAVVVRRLSGSELTRIEMFKLILKELGTGAITGSTIGILIAIIVGLWQNNMVLGLVIGLSLFCTLIVSTLAGASIPIIIQRFNIDPAVASGPFITTINDIVGLMIYFTISTLFMSYLL